MIKKWNTPKLIVLVRQKPEETILSACKATGTSDNPGYDDIGCDTIATRGACPSCDTRAAS